MVRLRNSRGGIIGSAVAADGWGVVKWSGLKDKVLIPSLAAPFLGIIVAAALMIAVLWIIRRRSPSRVNRVFRRLQLVSGGFVAFTHGTNDAQKTMGIISLALFTYGALGSEFYVPLWVMVLCATAMGLGTALGGWRIIKTMGFSLTELKPIHGFAAETTAATIIEAASRLGIPVSTTHVISSTILGVGATGPRRAVGWAVAGNIVTAWIVTIPACVVMGYASSAVMHALVK